jgi:hypothetical protein
MPDRLRYYVVSKDLQYGDGKLVSGIESMKKHMQRRKSNLDWTLVISIHGTIGYISVVGGKRDATQKGVYNAAKIKKIFNGDTQFTKWRDRWGPDHVVLVGCQIDRAFEAVILKALLKPTSKQKAVGLGKGCRPDTYPETFTWSETGSKPYKDIDSWSDWKDLSQDGRTALKDQLASWNKKYGYFGRPKVPDAQLLDYYFNEEPKGEWPIVTVSVNYKPSKVSYATRNSRPQFFGKMCPQHRKFLKRGKTKFKGTGTDG